MNDLEKKIFKMYNQFIYDICKNCEEHDNHLSSTEKRVGPISMFHIGKNLNNNENCIRILFVGKTSWNSSEDLNEYNFVNKIINVSTFGKEALNEYTSPFWVYIREITKKLNLRYDDIAITNLCKCNIYDYDSESPEEEITPFLYYDNCFKIFQKEVELIDPTHLIFFTSDEFDEYVIKLSKSFDKVIDKTGLDYRKKGVLLSDGITIGKGNPLWWYRVIKIENDGQINVLRTNHPGWRQMPGGMIDEIKNWVLQTS